MCVGLDSRGQMVAAYQIPMADEGTRPGRGASGGGGGGRGPLFPPERLDPGGGDIRPPEQPPEDFPPPSMPTFTGLYPKSPVSRLAILGMRDYKQRGRADLRIPWLPTIVTPPDVR
jgi:hypothetical protein